MAQHKHKKAINEFNKSINLNPHFAESYYFRGHANYILENMDSCCLDYKKASRLGYKNAEEAFEEYCN
jgi:tetratricopeptide (TPR) repeat protein